MQLLDKHKFREYWIRVWNLIVKKHVFYNASAITFNLIICSIPFTLILISIIGYVLSIDAAFDELIRYGRELLPNLNYERESGDVIGSAITLETIIEPLVNARTIFGVAGIAILMVFAQGLFHTMKHALFEIFDVEDRKHPIMELIHNFFAFGVIGGVFLFFSIAISIISLFSFNEISIPYTEIIIELGWMADFLTNVIPIIFMILLFYAIFRYISERRMQPKVALLSAITYTILFEVAKYGIGFYLEYALTAYRYFYQGYTVLIIIIFWVFYSAVLFVFTSILARSYQEIYLKEPVSDRNPYTDIS
ncbi:YihY/virulence factor BrkB family protein [Rhodohalobacter halophilus]|uniref:YihY/virulence factor BrkB family protein n=1 Tax=Rhodohalobacter halophilus TaxID=1812810 RepID=UPI000AECEF3E|nr:YihY/virulence factor BrkB family protein [Rhodohalobacter halophilus]